LLLLIVKVMYNMSCETGLFYEVCYSLKEENKDMREFLLMCFLINDILSKIHVFFITTERG